MSMLAAWAVPASTVVTTDPNLVKILQTLVHCADVIVVLPHAGATAAVHCPRGGAASNCPQQPAQQAQLQQQWMHVCLFAVSCDRADPSIRCVLQPALPLPLLWSADRCPHNPAQPSLLQHPQDRVAQRGYHWQVCRTMSVWF
jgi:glucose-6-phosphate dehydrogenase assembly protein OpcA